MLKLQRPTNRPSKQRERFDFKFSSFQALQVPKGWDRLFVSIVSVETGKTIAKLGKALVKNGTCHWTETISESISMSRTDSSKGYEDCLLKLLVSTGSTRSSNTLGEAVINMAQQTSSRASAAVSLPLKKCSYGSILQVKIQRVTPRSRIGDEGSKSSDSLEKVEDVESKSDNSNDSNGKPPREEDPATSSHPLKLDSEEASETATVLINSFSSMEGSFGRETISIENALKSEEYRSPQRQARGSNWSDLLPDHYSVDEDSLSNQSQADSRVHLKESFRDEAVVDRRYMANAGSSRNLLEAAEDTIEELRAEAKMWERNARKLMIDLDVSRKELSDMSKKQAELGMELSAAYAEQDWLRRQVEKMKIELQELSKNQSIREDPIIQPHSLQKELENEIKYQQYLNDDLSQQLKRSQESNIELVSVLQELEETMEQQRIEMEELSSLKIMDLQNSLAKSSEENRTLLVQLEQLKGETQLLDEAFRGKTNELEKERESSREILSQVEREYESKMLTKEEEIAGLEAKLSDYYIKDDELNRKDEDDVNHIRELESLREKVRGLEKDCIELTDENLELLCKLKESNKTDITKCPSFSDESEVSDPKYQVSYIEEENKKDVIDEVQIAGFEGSVHLAEIIEQIDIAFLLLMKPWYGKSSDETETDDDYLHGVIISDKFNTTEMSVEYVRSLLQELNQILETRMIKSDEILRHHEIEINDRNIIISEVRKKMEENSLEIQELEKSKAKSEESFTNLMRELEQKIVDLETIMLSKEQEADFLKQQRQELEAEVSELQLKTAHLEQDLEVALREKKISSECLQNLQNDLRALNDAVSSHVSNNTNLERNIEELVKKRHELDNTLSGLQEENTHFQKCISDLEAQVELLQDEKRLHMQEMENYKSSAMSLKDEMDIQILDLNKKSEDTMKRWLETQEECRYLKEENQQLHEKCSELVDQLSEMTKSLKDCTKEVESLQMEKLAEEERSSETLLERTAEFENLQIEMECLKQKLYDAHRERERISVESSSEFSSLLANKVELQTSLEEVQWEVESTKNKLEAALQESELKVQDLTDQLAASNQSQQRLMTEHERSLKLVANYRKIEEKLKTDLNDLELKHTISDYERQQLTKEMSVLKVQLQSMSDLQNEVSVLKSKIEECKLDKGKVERALHAISGDYEELKMENISLCEKISIFEGAMSEFEECKRNKLHLEEKLLQVEKDLNATQILSIQNADLKNELNEMKRSNMQFQQKMYILEEEKDECLQKAQSLEENLELIMQERNCINKEGAHNVDSLVLSGDNMTKRQLVEDEVASRSSGYGGTVARERYERTKSSLETELRDLRERYLEMSLKYAEVEEQREGLVMKLKASRSGKRWF